MRKFVFIILFLLGSGFVFAQTPRVSAIDPVVFGPLGEVNISGSGFGTNAGNVQVWFGAVQANITAITDNTLTVIPPVGAPIDNVSVLRLDTDRLGQSRIKPVERYYGEVFNDADLADPVNIANPNELFDICGCDFDNDKRVDLVSGVVNGGTNVLIKRNTSTIGAISFASTAIDVTTPVSNLACSDFDNDGKVDLVMSRSGANRAELFVFRNTSTGPGSIAFGARQQIFLLGNAVPFQANTVIARDMNKDGRLDLVVANGAENVINISLNNSTPGTLNFGTPQKFNLPEMTASSGLDVQDIDGDGNFDLILTRPLAANLYIYRNVGGALLSFEPAVILSTNQAVTNVEAADIDMDGKLDLITTQVFNNRVMVFKNNSSAGSVSFSAPAQFLVSNEPWTASPVDLNGDGFIDLAVSSRDQLAYSILLNAGTGINFTTVTKVVPQATRNIYTGDLDGDAKPEIAFTSFSIPQGQFGIQVIRNQNCYQPEFFNETPLAICTGQNILLEVPDAPGTTFSWERDGVGITGSGNSLDIILPGNYTVLALSEAGACSTSESILIGSGAATLPAAPVATNDGPGCVGNDVTLSIVDIVGANYEWTGPNGFTSSVREPVISNIQAEDAGIYTAVIKIGDCRSTEATTEVVVSAVEDFSITTSDATNICAGGTITLVTENRAGFAYQWLRDGSAISGANSSSYSATTAGDYSVQVTETATGCTFTTTSLTANILPAPIAAFNFNSPICRGIDAQFTNTSTVNNAANPVFSWDFGDGTSLNAVDATHAYATAGTYTVTLSISYSGVTGCSASTSQTITVVDATPVNITSDKTDICVGELATLTAAGTFTDLLWSTNETSASIEVTSGGTYSVTATDANGCVSTDEFNLLTGTIPDIVITANGEQTPNLVISEGDQVQLQATGADTYLWEPSDFLDDPNIPNPISTPSTAVTYTVTGALAGGCIGTRTITLSFVPIGTINITAAKAFSPNSTFEPTWQVEGVENYPDCTMSIYNEKGSLIYQQQGYTNGNGWDGTYDGSPVPEGVYYFVFNCTELEPSTGAVLLVR